MIYIASDHGGFELKKHIFRKLEAEDIVITDLGPEKFDPNDDYPDYVTPLVEKVLEDGENKGFLICRNGVGVSMAANKYKGIRATLSWSAEHAASSRNDDNTNVLCLPADYVSHKDGLEIVKVWLNTSFSNKDRHVRRVVKVNNLI